MLECVCTHFPPSVHLSVCPSAHAHKRRDAHVHTDAKTHTCTHAQTPTGTTAHMRAHTRTHTHTHVQAPTHPRAQVHKSRGCLARPDLPNIRGGGCYARLGWEASLTFNQGVFQASSTCPGHARGVFGAYLGCVCPASVPHQSCISCISPSHR